MTTTATQSSVRRLSPAGRRRRWRRRLRRPVVAVLAVATLLGATSYLALGTDVLAVKEVTVAGAGAVPGSAVIVAAQVPAGVPMLRLDRGAIQSRVLRALPGVAAVSVEREWPSTVRLVVRERTAAAAVPHNGKYLLVDRNGVVFRTVVTAPPSVPVLRVARPGPDDTATVAGMSVLFALPPEVGELVARVDAPTAEQVVLILRDRRQVVWGSASDAAAKAAVVNVLLARPGKVIDVSSPGLATVR